MKVLYKHKHDVILILALLAILSYFLHVIIGTMKYPGYDYLTQAVSELTSDDAPSKEIARFLSGLYGVFSSLVGTLLFYIYKKESRKGLKYGIYCLSTMYLVSAIGYGLFPLSSETNVMNVQNIMHIVVTVCVVLLTIISLILLSIAFWKMRQRVFASLTMITFVVLMVSAILTNVVPKDYFGLVERFSVYSVVIYIGVIASFNYLYHKNKEVN